MDKRSQFRTLIHSAITSGKFRAGERLPTENEFSRQYGISRVTVREGFAALARDGILVRRRGAGTFVGNITPGCRSKTVAAILPGVLGAEGVYDQIIHGIENEVQERNYSLMLCNYGGDPEKVKRYISRLLEEKVAGFLFTPMVLENYRSVNLSFLHLFEDTGLPFVLVDNTISEDFGRFSFVGSAGFQAMREMTRHLISLGHRRIAYINGVGGFNCERRLGGFVEEMQRQGLEVPSEHVLTLSEKSQTDGRLEIRELMALKSAPTAVICFHDLLAKNVLAELRVMGMRVPDDIAVVGFDDLNFAEHWDPPLTTVRQPLSEVGGTAVSVLMDKLEGKLVGEIQRLLPCRIVVRASCGAGVKPIQKENPGENQNGLGK